MSIERFFLLAAAFFPPMIAKAELVKFDCPAKPNAPAYDRGRMLDISVFHLIARPDRYEGKSATVTGVLRAASSKMYLYPTIDSATHEVSSLAVVLRKPKCIDYTKWASLGKFSGTYVSVYGVYLSDGYESVEAGGGELVEIAEIGSHN